MSNHTLLKQLLLTTEISPNRLVKMFKLTRQDVIDLNTELVGNTGGTKLVIKKPKIVDGFTADDYENVYIMYFAGYMIANNNKFDTLEEVRQYISNLV